MKTIPQQTINPPAFPPEFSPHYEIPVTKKDFIALLALMPKSEMPRKKLVALVSAMKPGMARDLIMNRAREIDESIAKRRTRKQEKRQGTQRQGGFLDLEVRSKLNSAAENPQPPENEASHPTVMPARRPRGWDALQQRQYSTPSARPGLPERIRGSRGQAMPEKEEQVFHGRRPR